MTAEGAAPRLQRPLDPARDHVRGGSAADAVSVVGYVDFLCPYCRRWRQVMLRLRQALGERVLYAHRHFPNERAHPGAERLARAAEAAAEQGRFWEVHDWIFDHELPISDADLLEFVRSLGLDMARFTADLDGDEARRRVAEDLDEGRRSGVTGTPALFVGGVRYDGAWDFHSMLEALQLPVAARVQRTARAFASLPASGGLVLLLAAAAALVLANTPLRPYYESLVSMPLTVGAGGRLSMTVAEWFSQGLLSVFFLLVGLEIRRESTAGALAEPGTLALPVIAAVGGDLVPAAIYLALNPGPAAHGWAIPTATDLAFVLGILALLGRRIPPGIRVFVAALAVADDVLSVVTLAVFYPRDLAPGWLVASAGATALLYVLNRWRVYAVWPYALAAVVLWVTLHDAGVPASLAGFLLAVFLPTRPAPEVGPLLAQAATALTALEQAESDPPGDRAEGRHRSQESIWDWATRNLSAAGDRLLSPADRVERALGPWSTYLVLPLFAFSAAGVHVSVDHFPPGAERILGGIVLGLLVGKPLGITVATWLATRAGIAVGPDGVTPRQMIGAACLCGIAGTVALLVAEEAFAAGPELAIAKLGVLVGSAIAAVVGTLVLVVRARPAACTPAPER